MSNFLPFAYQVAKVLANTHKVLHHVGNMITNNSVNGDIFAEGDGEKMGRIRRKLAMGWLPDYPDFRDYTVEKDDISLKLKRLGVKDSIKGMFSKAGVQKPVPKENLPPIVDLRKWCPPIEDQESLGSCTAQAAVGMIEYFEKKAFKKHLDGSRLFVYKATRNMLGWTGDTGAFIRTAMGALVLFGAPPEDYWPYVIADFDKEPPAFCYAYAQNYQAIQYVRLDPPDTPKEVLLDRVKTNLAAGFPSMFGFSVYSSIWEVASDGKIPYPCENETLEGGHAVVAVGYDDDLKIKNKYCDIETTGALLIRNSWGIGWGDNGYGWLPYDYVKNDLAIDWWILLKGEWVDTGEFHL